VQRWQLRDVQPGLQEGSGHGQEGVVLGGCRWDLALDGNPNLAIPTKPEENSFSLAVTGNKTILRSGLTDFPSQNHKKTQQVY